MTSALTGSALGYTLGHTAKCVQWDTFERSAGLPVGWLLIYQNPSGGWHTLDVEGAPGRV